MLEPGIWRGVFTVFMFVAFIGIFIWAYSSRRKGEFDEMANLPLEQDNFVEEHGKPAGVVPQGEDES
jgi:cytochrome c oxidase cbb3-type subunit 4